MLQILINYIYVIEFSLISYVDFSITISSLSHKKIYITKLKVEISSQFKIILSIYRSFKDFIYISCCIATFLCVISINLLLCNRYLKYLYIVFIFK